MDRISNVEQSAIDEGIFRPYTISPNIAEAFQTHADEMGGPNPLDAAYDAIYDIQGQLSDLSLDDLFPDITNPLIPMGLGMTLPPLGGRYDITPSGRSHRFFKFTWCQPSSSQHCGSNWKYSI